MKGIRVGRHMKVKHLPLEKERENILREKLHNTRDALGRVKTSASAIIKGETRLR